MDSRLWTTLGVWGISLEAVALLACDASDTTCPDGGVCEHVVSPVRDRDEEPWLGAAPDEGDPDDDAGEPGECHEDGSCGCRSDSDCDDGDFCNGAERCILANDDDAGSERGLVRECVSGRAPCSVLACDEESDSCDCLASNGRRAWFCGGDEHDADGDGFDGDAKDPILLDCDDRDPIAYPGGDEVCDTQHKDEDCDLSTVASDTGVDPVLADVDHDGYVGPQCANRDSVTGELHYDANMDCNDQIAEDHPGADTQDICDDRDNNCNGFVDESFEDFEGRTDDKPLRMVDRGQHREFCIDIDGDTFPARRSDETMIVACGAPLHYVDCRDDEDEVDCNDDPEQRGYRANREQDEQCDGMDNDCDGLSDNRPDGGLLPGEETDGPTTIECRQGRLEITGCPEGRAWCNRDTIAAGCETDIARLTRCASCVETDCRFACDASSGCEEVAQVRMGSGTACAATTLGRVACWGRGSEGQLGNDAELNSSIPTMASIGDVHEVVVGAGHACAIAGEERLVSCWGDNSELQIAASQLTSAVPRPIDGGDLALGVAGAKQLATHHHHTCAVMEDHSVLCWGQARYGQLGDPTLVLQVSTAESGAEVPPLPAFPDASKPRLVSRWNGADDYAVIRDAEYVTVGMRHSCTRTAEDRVQCWGDNSRGQLGADPQAISIGQGAMPVELPGRATGVSAGDQHTCAIVDGRVYCWGANYAGQLGRVSETPDHEPQEVAGLKDVVAVAAGSLATCALDSLGDVYCWGEASESARVGELPFSSEPAKVSLPDAAFHLTLNGSGCAHLVSSEVWCWGFNHFGQLGTGIESQQPELTAARIRSVAGSRK